MNFITAKFTGSSILITVKRRDIRFPFYLRCLTSDIPAYDQVYVSREYDFAVSRHPKVIMDAGANIGLASIYFANRYPDSQIIAVEPEASNFELLKTNVTPYRNVIPLQAALWNKDEEINLVDPGMGKWGFMTQARDGSEEVQGVTVHKTRGLTVDTIMRKQKIERIDILKIDIEGSEREVFSNSSPWIEKVDALIIELHERIKPGCCHNFYTASKGFDDQWMQGENVYLSRSVSCLAAQAVKD